MPQSSPSNVVCPNGPESERKWVRRALPQELNEKRARVVLAELSNDLKALESSRIASYRDALTAADRGIAARAAAAILREDKEGVDILNTHVTGLPKGRSLVT